MTARAIYTDTGSGYRYGYVSFPDTIQPNKVRVDNLRIGERK